MKSIIFILVSLLPVLSIAQKLTLTGTIKGLPDDTKIVLTDLQNPGPPLAEAQSKSGAFAFDTAEAASCWDWYGDSIKTAVFLAMKQFRLQVQSISNQTIEIYRVFCTNSLRFRIYSYQSLKT